MSTIDPFVNDVSLSAYVANEKMTRQILGDMSSISLIKNPMTRQKITQPSCNQLTNENYQIKQKNATLKRLSLVSAISRIFWVLTNS